MIMIVMIVMMVMIQTLSHTHKKIATQDAFAQTLLYKNSLQQGVYTQNLFHTHRHARFYTSGFYTHTQTDAFTQSRFYIHRISSDIGAPLHTVPSNPKLLNTQKLLRREAFTYRWFTQTNLCTGAAHRKNSHSQSFYAKVLLHNAAFTRRSFFAQKLWQTENHYAQFSTSLALRLERRHLKQHRYDYHMFQILPYLASMQGTPLHFCNTGASLAAHHFFSYHAESIDNISVRELQFCLVLTFSCCGSCNISAFTTSLLPFFSIPGSKRISCTCLTWRDLLWCLVSRFF